MNFATLCTALATALAAWVLTQKGKAPLDSCGRLSLLEQSRQRHLENHSLLYAWFGNALRTLAKIARALPQRWLDAIGRELGRGSRRVPWTASEWVAATFVRATFVAVVAVIIWRHFGGGLPSTLLVLASGAAGTAIACWSRLRSGARIRIGAIRERLPFVIDSIALAIDAGVSIQEAIPMAANSCRDTPLGDELGCVVTDVRRGRSLVDALSAMKARLSDPVVDEFLMATCASHQLGSSVAEVLLAMATRMRQRRSHEIESAVGRAQVRLYYPGILLLVVCAAAVLVPFVAPMLNFLSPTQS